MAPLSLLLQVARKSTDDFASVSGARRRERQSASLKRERERERNERSRALSLADQENKEGSDDQKRGSEGKKVEGKPKGKKQISESDRSRQTPFFLSLSLALLLSPREACGTRKHTHEQRAHRALSLCSSSRSAARCRSSSCSCSCSSISLLF